MTNAERILLIIVALVVGLAGGVISARLLPQHSTTLAAKEIVLLDQQGDVRASVSIEAGRGSSVVFKDHAGKVIGTIPATPKLIPLQQ